MTAQSYAGSREAQGVAAVSGDPTDLARLREALVGAGPAAAVDERPRGRWVWESHSASLGGVVVSPLVSSDAGAEAAAGSYAQIGLDVGGIGSPPSPSDGMPEGPALARRWASRSRGWDPDRTGAEVTLEPWMTRWRCRTHVGTPVTWKGRGCPLCAAEAARRPKTRRERRARAKAIRAAGGV